MSCFINCLILWTVLICCVMKARVIFCHIVTPGEYFPPNWLRPRLSNVGLFEVTGVRFLVFDIGLFLADDSVRFDTESVVSDVTGDRYPYDNGCALVGRCLHAL